MTSQYGAYALRAGLARLHAGMRMHMPTCLGTHMHARTSKHAHTDQCAILTAFPQQQRFVNAPQYYAMRTLPVLFFYLQHTTQTSVPPAEFEPAIPTIYWPQNLALDHTATGIGTIRSPDRRACSKSLYRLSYRV